VQALIIKLPMSWRDLFTLPSLLVVAAAVVAGGIAALLNTTRLGLEARAVTNEPLARGSASIAGMSASSRSASGPGLRASPVR
jgi:branched-subunit amino acid ABC-type transport system permease component